jgi:hypothetical protein
MLVLSQTKQMNGYKTYTGLVAILLGLVLGKYFSESELVVIASAILEIGGLAFAGYGRYKATK